MKSFELNLDEINKINAFLIVALGDFNAKSKIGLKMTKQRMKGLNLIF